MSLRRLLLIHEMRSIMVVIFGVTMLSRMALVIALQIYKRPERVEIQKVAQSIAERGVFADPYARPTGPTAHDAPLYPIILGGVFSIFGTGRGGEVAEYVMNSAAVALVYALLPLAAQALMLPIRVGVLAALIGISVPVHYEIELRGGEAAFSSLFLLCLFFANARLWGDSAFGWRKGFLHGLYWGVALLLSPSLLPVGLGWLIAAFARYRTQVLRYAAGAAVTAALVLMPWAIRNAVVLGSPILFRSNFGLELQTSNNPLARATLNDTDHNGGYRVYHPSQSLEQVAQVRRLGEVEYNREKLDQALTWIRQSPGRFALLTLARTVFFWFPKTTLFWIPQGARIAQSVVLWVLTGLAFAGFTRLWRTERAGGVLIGAIWLFYPSIYYVLQADNHYRYPIHWTLVLLAAFAVDRCSSKTRSDHPSDSDVQSPMLVQV